MVWQMTDDYCDEHTCYLLVRGGSNYKQQHIARYYFAQPRDLTEHNTWIAMSESMDRVGTIGFRCVVDAGEPGFLSLFLSRRPLSIDCALIRSLKLFVNYPQTAARLD